MHRVHKALDAHIEPSVAHAIRTVAGVARSHGVRSWLVGGTVRDAILGISSRHQVPDIVVAGDVHAIADDCIRRADGSELLAHSMFQTCRIQLDGQVVELAAARKDTYEPHGALPNIERVSHILDDLPRRDFSINAMAVEVTPTGYGEFHDPFHGVDDCTNSILRVLHREAFSEDPTRILRGIRLAARYDLRIEPDTVALLSQAVPTLTALHSQSPSRIFAELTRWFEPHENLHGIVCLAHEYGVLQALHMQPTSELHLETLRHLPDSSDTDSKIAAFLQVLDSDALNRLSQNLPLTRRWLQLVDGTSRFSQVVEGSDWDTLTDSEVANELRRFDEAVVHAATTVLGNDQLAARLRRLNQAARSTKSLMSGREVADLGIRPGREVGDTLREIVDRRIDGQIATREDEVGYIRKRISAGATQRD